MEKETIKYISQPTIKRLPLYLNILRNLPKDQNFVSSSYIAAELKLEPIQVRKDVSSLGITGQARMGFNALQLIETIESVLGWSNTRDAFVVGVGSLGTAILGYKGFEDHGLKIIAGFDNDVKKVTTKVHGREIFHVNQLAELARRMNIQIGILTVPNEVAEITANLMVKAGIKAIWNFTQTKLFMPHDVIVERVDLASSFAVLSSKLVEQKTKGAKSEA